MEVNETEIEIIKKFVINNKQDRLIWELSNPKKRSKMVFQRLHDYSIFKNGCLQPVNYMWPDKLEECLLQLSGAREVYYMGLHYIGKLSLRDAVMKADECDICIIYCGNGVGYYQGEQSYGGTPRFIMRQEVE